MEKETIALTFWGKIFATIGVFFMPLLPAMIAVGILIGIDTVFGVIAAKKRKEIITSRKFSMCLIKLLVYNLLIISAHLVELFLFEQIPFVKLTIGFIGLSEFLSIGESFSTITGKSFALYLKEYIVNLAKRNLK